MWHGAKKSSKEKFQIGHILDVTEPACAFEPGAKTDDGKYIFTQSADDDDFSLAEVSSGTHDFRFPNQSFLEVGSMGSKCYQQNKEYGNWMEGACGAAELVALYADEDCLSELEKQDWFTKPQTTGNDVSEMTIEKCQKACQDNADCGNFQFSSNPGWCPNSCWLKTGLNCGKKGYTSSKGMVSGPRTCPKERKTPCTMTYEVPAASKDTKKKYGTDLMCFSTHDSCPPGCTWTGGTCMLA